MSMQNSASVHNVGDQIQKHGSYLGKSFTEIIYVNPDGDDHPNKIGTSWLHAHTSIVDALNNISTDPRAFTLIVLGSNDDQWDINLSDPTFSSNFFIDGAERPNTSIKNTHPSALSVLNLTGQVYLNKISIDCKTAKNGLIASRGSCVLNGVVFDGSQLSSNAVLCEGLDAKIKIFDCCFIGDATKIHSTALKVLNQSFGRIENNGFFFGSKGMDLYSLNTTIFNDNKLNQIQTALTIDSNCIDLCFQSICFNNCDTRIIDEGLDTLFGEIKLDREINKIFPISVSSGILVTAAAGIDTFGSWIEIDDGSSFTKPFKLTNIYVSETSDEKTEYMLDLAKGSIGNEEIIQSIFFYGTKEAKSETILSGVLPAGTRLSARIKTANGGSDSCRVWLKYMEY